jgi:putative SOS response-associated peptidase YedK
VCGRFFRHSPRDEIAAAFRAQPSESADLPLGYNIAPSSTVLAVRFDGRTGERTLDGLHWGLIPHWAENKKVAWKLTNARSETVDSLPSYRGAFAKRRCLIVANGFYEWRAIGEGSKPRKQPYAFAAPDHHVFAMAGLWENWKDPESGLWLRSCTIITTDANAVVASVHDRMPVILHPEHHARWLGEEPEHAHELKALLRPLAPELLMSWPVTPALNKPGAIDDARLLDQVAVPEDEDPQTPLGA